MFWCHFPAVFSCTLAQRSHDGARGKLIIKRFPCICSLFSACLISCPYSDTLAVLLLSSDGEEELCDNQAAPWASDVHMEWRPKNTCILAARSIGSDGSCLALSRCYPDWAFSFKPPSSSFFTFSTSQCLEPCKIESSWPCKTFSWPCKTQLCDDSFLCLDLLYLASSSSFFSPSSVYPSWAVFPSLVVARFQYHIVYLIFSEKWMVWCFSYSHVYCCVKCELID